MPYRYADHQSGQHGVDQHHGSINRDPTENDVMLEVLLADYTMSLENVPTMIE